MSTQNAVSINIPSEKITQVNTKLAEIREILKPYLVALSADQRQTLPKMGDKTLSFVSKTLDYIKSNPEFAPPFLNVEELKTDLQAASDLEDMKQILKPIYSDVNDTELICGSEAYVAALTYYNCVKQASKNNQPSAKSIYEDLKVRFEKTNIVSGIASAKVSHN